jgi:hypothetical protein
MTLPSREVSGRRSLPAWESLERLDPGGVIPVPGAGRRVAGLWKHGGRFGVRASQGG